MTRPFTPEQEARIREIASNNLSLEKGASAQFHLLPRAWQDPFWFGAQFAFGACFALCAVVFITGLVKRLFA